MPTAARRSSVAAGVLLASFITGAALSIFKGDGTGLQDWLGNASAPYLLVPLLAGLTCRGRRAAALIGIATTELTLAGFYWAWIAILHHDVGWRTLLIWGLPGAVTGALCGIAGFQAAKRPALLYLVPALLILEPTAQRLAALADVFGNPDLPPIGLLAYVIEIASGLATLAPTYLAARALASRQRHQNTPA